MQSIDAMERQANAGVQKCSVKWNCHFYFLFSGNSKSQASFGWQQNEITQVNENKISTKMGVFVLFKTHDRWMFLSFILGKKDTR